MIQIKVDEQCFLKDPSQTNLGERIIGESVNLIADLGFEAFNFKKLAKKISSTEASIYRYFENKHKLLLYLMSWYWTWLSHKLDYETHNIINPKQKLACIIKTLATGILPDPSYAHINETDLQSIVIDEASKTMHTKGVEHDDKDGYFTSYKGLIEYIAQCMHSINPEYKYCNNLATLLIESAHQQQFLSIHFKSLSDLSQRKTEQDLVNFLNSVIFATLKCSYEENI